MCYTLQKETLLSRRSTNTRQRFLVILRKSWLIMAVSFAMMNLKLYLKTLTLEYALNQPSVHGAMILLRQIMQFLV